MTTREEAIAKIMSLPPPRTLSDVMAALAKAAEEVLRTGVGPAVGTVSFQDFCLMVESTHFRWGGRPPAMPGLLVDGLGGTFEGWYVLVRPRHEFSGPVEMQP